MKVLLSEVERRLGRIVTGGGPPLPRWEQDWFPRLDGAVAYTVVDVYRPARIVEIGSGHSTRFMAKALSDGDFGGRMICIDPAPRASLAGLAVDHRPHILSVGDGDLVAALGPGDILFVDSSHVAMPGTDVDVIVGELLPRLQGGVLVHFHDVFLPDGYPDQWRWRGYNEQIVLAALLQGGGYDVLFSSHWLVTRRADWLSLAGVTKLPLRAGALESSLWLRKRTADAVRMS